MNITTRFPKVGLEDLVLVKLSLKPNLALVILFLILIMGSLTPPSHHLLGTSPNSSLSISKGVDFPFKISMPNVSRVDRDSNGIEDEFEFKVKGKVARGDGNELADIVVLLNRTPTNLHTSIFRELGGFITRGPWRHALYGFAGRIPYKLIERLAERLPNLLLIQEDYPYKAFLSYATRQGRVRTYVWDDLGFKGDPSSAIAILDTGIDDSHVNHLGYGDADFNKKIVGWHDSIGAGVTPYDDNGHGSHCAGISAGDGFYTMDDQGRAVATWSAASLSGSPGDYIVTGFNVTRTGIIEIYIEISARRTVRLYYAGFSGDPDTWIEVASVTTPGGGGSTTLTYTVDSAHLGYYHISIQLKLSPVDAYFVIHWPYDPPSDGYSAWTGVAPDARLVGVKVLDAAGIGSTSSVVDGIDWVVANRVKYHILVLSMSFGGSTYDPAVDTAVTNAVNSGIVCVAAAGNYGPGGNYIHSPGSNPYAITVAAISSTDNITSYSSQGGVSEANLNVVKPDIAAPGGSFYLVPIFSSDSNDQDAENSYSDYYVNDSAPMQGTSMSTPFIAGCAAIVAEALGGFSGWDYTSNSSALKVKALLLMTATETYPLLREGKTTTYSPTLDRGGKDVHEGYGRVNLDAAVEAAVLSWDPSVNESETLYAADYILTDRSSATYRHAWARRITLQEGYMYSFVLNVPDTGDFDLYIYSSSPGPYGEPVIKWKSTNAGMGVDEVITTDYITADEAGTYIFVVKAVSGYGTFYAGYASPPVPIPESPFTAISALATMIIIVIIYKLWKLLLST